MLQLCKTFLILLTVLALALPAGVGAEPSNEGETQGDNILPFDVDAEAAILMEPDTGTLLYAKNADIPLPPASITKMMTQLLAFEALRDGRASLEDVVVVSERAWRLGGSTMFLNAGQKVTFEDLITGISVVSANDACIAVAEHLTGSEEMFVRNMNDRAASLGMFNTRFENSTGLPSAGHYMSARDIALLGQEIVLNHPDLLELESQLSFTFNDIKQANRNKLLGSYPGADGLKTGWTEEAGFCLAATAIQGGTRLIAVALGTKDDGIRLAVTRQLLDYGFRNFAIKEILSPGDIAGEIPLEKGRERELPVTVASPLRVMAPLNRDVELVKNIPIQPEAPLSRGDKVGTIRVVFDGHVIKEGALVAADDARQANIVVRLFRSAVDFVMNLIQSRSRSR